MDTIALFVANQGLQSVYTPFTFKMHLGFCIIATILYLLQYYRKGSWHYIVLMAAIDLTFVTQTSLCQTGSRVAVLGIVEVALLAIAAVLNYRYSKQLKLKNAEANAAADEQDERRKAAEREQSEKDGKVVDNAFED